MWCADPGGPGPNPSGRRRPCAKVAGMASDPFAGERATTVAADIPFASVAWGRPADRPLVLIHGVTASSAVWWRIGPALAATGRRVVAVDLPGHGLTGHWMGHHRFRDNAADVAAWLRATGLDVPEVQIVGHSWGAMTAAALPVNGIRPATLVLVDPPAIPHAIISLMASDPSEQVVPGPRDGRDRPGGGQPVVVERRRAGQGRGPRASSMSTPHGRSSSTTATGTAGWPTSPTRPRTGSRSG